MIIKQDLVYNSKIIGVRYTLPNGECADISSKRRLLIRYIDDLYENRIQKVDDSVELVLVKDTYFPVNKNLPEGAEVTGINSFRELEVREVFA